MPPFRRYEGQIADKGLMGSVPPWRFLRLQAATYQINSYGLKSTTDSHA